MPIIKNLAQAAGSDPDWQRSRLGAFLVRMAERHEGGMWRGGGARRGDCSVGGAYGSVPSWTGRPNTIT